MKISMFKRMYVSVLVGIALIIPGLSGGTILSSSGTLEDLTSNAWEIPKKNNKNFKTNLTIISVYVLFIMVGAAFAATIIESLLEKYTLPLYITFIVLMCIAIPAFIKSNKIKKLLNGPAVFGFVLIVGLSFLDILIVDNEQSSIILLIIASILAGASVLVPGLSGSLMLLLLGQYKEVLRMITERELWNINLYIFGASALIGLIVVSKMLDMIFKKNKEKLINISWGLVVGSVVALSLAAFKEVTSK